MLNYGFKFCRISRIGAGTCRGACKSTLRISIGTTQVPGKQLCSESPCACITDELDRILEYVTREEAETALRHLDGRDIRGRPVRVQYAPERAERVCWHHPLVWVCFDLWSSSARQKSPHGTTTVDTMAGDVTHTILAVEDRGPLLLVEGKTTTLVVVVVAVVGTTRRGITVAPAVAVVAVAEGRGALKPIVLHPLQEGTRMTARDSMVTMEGEVEKATAIGMYAVLPLPSM